jgi:hypothetical protein
MKYQSRLIIQLFMFLFVNAAITVFAMYIKIGRIMSSKLRLNKHL